MVRGADADDLDLPHRITASAGVTVTATLSPDRQRTFTDTLNLADSALYRAKEAVRNRVVSASAVAR